MTARKFGPGQEWVSASELAANILDAIRQKQFVLTQDLSENNKDGFYFDSGYIVAMNDILTMVMIDPKSVSADQKVLNEEGNFNLGDIE